MKKSEIAAKIEKIKNLKAYKIARMIKNVICWVLFIVLAFTLIVFMTTRIQGNTPTVFGYSIFRISSGSMEPELMVGDIILDKEIKDESEISVGDVVTFEGCSQFDDLLVTHKVIKAPYTDENGNVMLQTKGVANEVKDDPIKFSQVRAKVICKVPYIDTLYNLFLSPSGLLIMILLIILAFIDEIISVVKVISGKDERRIENINEIIERLQSDNQQADIDTSDDNTDKSEAEK
ncbi:MAG: signal peptidase I [Acutalibacteraceae bacterium]